MGIFNGDGNIMSSPFFANIFLNMYCKNRSFVLYSL
jgi:hypothetical protein